MHGCASWQHASKIGKVLEHAYLWVLACKSYKLEEVTFGEQVVDFQCKGVQPGHIFEGNSNSLDSAKVAGMKPATLYYAEGNHPCADIFFKGDTGALYLVDVGGTSDMMKARKKSQKMNDIVCQERLRDDLGELTGVVLLPNIMSITFEEAAQAISETIMVTGAEARNLLGGLVQLLAWLSPV